MRAVFSSLLTVWMVILTVSGWCCHPLSGCAHAQHSSVAASSTGCCKHCQNRERQKPAVPHKCNSECQGICVFLPSQKVQLDDQQVSSLLDVAAIISSRAESQPQSTLGWEGRLDPVCFEPPLRLYLMHRALLV